MGSKFSESVFIRNRRGHQEERRRCEDGGGDASEAPTITERQELRGKLGVRHGMVSPSESPQGVNPANTGFWTSGLLNGERINFSCFKPLILWLVVMAA